MNKILSLKGYHSWIMDFQELNDHSLNIEEISNYI